MKVAYVFATNMASTVKMIMKYILSIIAVLSIGITANAENKGSFSGAVVSEGGEAISFATIQARNASWFTTTGNDGQFRLYDIPPGEYTLDIRAFGYFPLEKTVKFNAGDNLIETFVLKINPLELDEVVVTANRRSQSLQRTAASVSAIKAKQVEQQQVNNINGLNSLAPNFRSYDDGGPGSFTLFASRGISTIDFNPIIGLYVDDIPYFTTYAFPLSLSDVENIEVLRGPQGTLYGRNALAGVVKITTKTPTNALEGYVSSDFGNLGYKNFNASISGPLNDDKLFFRLSSVYTDQDGFVKNQFNNKDLQNREAYDINSRIRYYPTEKLIVSLKHNFQWRTSDGYAFVVEQPEFRLQDAINNSPYEVNFNEDVFRTTKTNSFALDLKYGFRDFILNSVSAYQITDIKRLDEFDYSVLDVQSAKGEADFRNLSQEIRLVSDSDARLAWTTGVFAYRNTNKNIDDFRTGTDMALMDPSQADIVPYERNDDIVLTQTGVAIYGETSYALTDLLTTTLGLRYDFEETQADIARTYSSPLFPASDFNPSASFNALSPKLALSFQASDGIFVFANISRGFRAGGINQFVLDEEKVAFDPENTLNAEIGLKTTLLENRLRANLTAFYINYTDQQVYTILNLQNFDFGTDNIGESRSIGIEFESQVALTKSIKFGLNLGYLDTEILDYMPIDFGTFAQVDYSGNKLPLSPELNGNFNLNFIQPVSDRINIEASLDYIFQSDIYFEVSNNTSQEAYGLLNGRIGITSRNIDFFIWAKNLADKVYFSYGYGVGGFNAASYGMPRTVGAALTAKF